MARLFAVRSHRYGSPKLPVFVSTEQTWSRKLLAHRDPDDHVLLGQSLNFNRGMAAVFRAVIEASPEPHIQKENNHNGCTMG